ncbi:MAG TPA: carboxypeptidase-like regulatory domain-containing protein, partial [Polyangiaceae bacterium]|nr:carboxypeptidase-like regulatory domain-containing protein [Polyangiaceae bacterium]
MRPPAERGPFMVIPVPPARLTAAFARAITATVAVVVVAGTIPGERLRRLVDHHVALELAADASDRDGSVDVAVHSAAGGAPLAGAHVRALSILDDLPYVVDDRDTGESGHALLTRLPHGATWILVDAPGCARGSTRLVVDSQPRAVTIDLDPEHVIEVVVRDDGAVAIAGAEIEVVAAGDPLPVGARAGNDGGAHVGRLASGPWHVTARAPGYEEASGRATNDGETVSIALRKLGSLAVHVVGEGASAVSGAHVSVAGATLWPARAAETDARGDLRIGGLLAGVYAVRASLGDRVSGIELGISLARGEEKAIVLTLAPGRWVGVRVTDGDSGDAEGIAAARVMLAEGGLSPFPLEATTDAKGRARLGPIAAGAATLSVR